MNEIAGATGAQHKLEVAPRIVRAFFSKKLIKPGQKSEIHVQTQNVEDGVAVDVTLIKMGGTASVTLKTTTLSGKIDKNMCSLEWTAELDGLVDGRCPLTPITLQVKIGVLPLLLPGTNFLAVANFGALIQSCDPSFCPGSESLQVSYSILDPFKFVRAGVLRIYGNQVEGKSYPEESAVVYQRLLAPEELTTGTHTVEWQGFCNAESGPFAPAGDGDIKYVNPLHSPYVVDVQLLDRVVTDAGSWPQDDALLSLPAPLTYRDLGLDSVGDGAEIAPEGAAAKHAAFEITIADVALELGTWVESEATMPTAATAATQYQLNQLGYFCGPVDGKSGPLTEKGIAQFRRTHYSVPEAPDDPRVPLGDKDTAKVDATVDEATKRAIAMESEPRAWMRVLDGSGKPLLDDSGEPIVNRLPGPGEAGQVVLDGSVFYQEGKEFWDSSQSKPAVTKQDREVQWIPRPWIPVEARPRLRNRKGQPGTPDESRLGCLGLRVLWRVADPLEEHANLGFPTGPLTALQYKEHTIGSVVLAGINTNTGVKHRLLRLGYEPGAVNDTLDDEAKDAIRTFQSDYGLAGDGVITPETRTELNTAHGASLSESLFEIAAKYGVDDPNTLLSDPANKEIDDAVSNLHELPVGKKLKIPPFVNFAKYKEHKEGKPEKFVNATVGNYKGTADGDWIADNAPDKVDGKPNYGARTHDESRRGTDYVRHFDKFFKLLPWEPVEVDDTRAGRGKMLATKTSDKGPKRGRTGLYFVPSIIGGDNYRIEAWVDLEKGPDGKDLANSVWLTGRYPDGSPIGRSGTMTVWREIVLSEYLYIRDRKLEPAKLAQADWDRFRAIYRQAYGILKLPADTNGKSISEADYQRIVAHAYGCAPESLVLDRDQFYPNLSPTLTADEAKNHPLALPEQTKLSDAPLRYEDASAYYAKVNDKVSDFHAQFANAMGTEWERTVRTGATIVDFRRNNAYFPLRKTDGTFYTNAQVRAWLEGKFLSTGQAKGVLLMDQRDPDAAHYVWAHELGHSLFLYHWKNTGENNTQDHDNDDDYCVMMYPGAGEAAKIDPDFCGKCLLKLRGWNEKALPATAPSGGGGSTAKSGGAGLDTSGCESTDDCGVVAEGLRLREQVLLALDAKLAFDPKKKRLEAAHFVRQVAENAAETKSSYADEVWENLLGKAGQGEATGYPDSFLREELEALEGEEKRLDAKLESAIDALIVYLRDVEVQKHLVEHHAGRTLSQSDADAVYATDQCSATLPDYRELDHLVATFTEHLSVSANGRAFLAELMDPSKMPSHPAFADVWSWVGKVQSVAEPAGKFLYNLAPVLVDKAQRLGAAGKIATIDDILADPDLARHFQFLREKTGVDIPSYLTQRAYAIEDKLSDLIAKADERGKTLEELKKFDDWFAETDAGKTTDAMKKLDGAWCAIMLDFVALGLSASKLIADGRKGDIKLKDALGVLNDVLGASKTAVETYKSVLVAKLGQGADTTSAGTRIFSVKRAETSVKVMGKFAAVIGFVVASISLYEGIKRRDGEVIVMSLAAMFTSVVAFFAPASWSGALAIAGFLLALLTVLILDPKLIDFLEDTPWGEHSPPGKTPVIAADKVIDEFYKQLFSLSAFVSTNSLDAELASITIRSGLLRDGLPVVVEVKKEKTGTSLGRFSVDPAVGNVNGKGRVVKHALSWAGYSNVDRTIHIMEPWQIWPEIERDGDTAHVIKVQLDPDRDLEFELEETLTGAVFPPPEPPLLTAHRDGLFAGMQVVWKSTTCHVVYPSDGLLRLKGSSRYAKGCTLKVRAERDGVAFYNPTLDEVNLRLAENDFEYALKVEDPGEDGTYQVLIHMYLYDHRGNEVDSETKWPAAPQIVTAQYARQELGWNG